MEAFTDTLPIVCNGFKEGTTLVVLECTCVFQPSIFQEINHACNTNL